MGQHFFTQTEMLMYAHSIKRIFIVFSLFFSASFAFTTASIPLHNPLVIIPESTPEPVRIAAHDFCRDAYKATHITLTATSALPTSAKTVIIPAVIGSSPYFNSVSHSAAYLTDAWESYAIIPVTNPFPNITHALFIAGSDVRGTVYGIYKASEIIYGTDPQYFWTDYQQPYVTNPVWSGKAFFSPSPDFTYRVIYFNDEDQLANWKGTTPDNAFDDTLCDALFETIMRMGANAIAPPVHAAPFTSAQKERAHERGILGTGTTGFEALRGAPNLTWQEYCRERFHTNLPYSFTLYPEIVTQFWTDIVTANKDFIDIWPVGMRGTHDWPFWMDDPAAPTSMSERAALVTKAIHLQTGIIHSVCGPDRDRAFIFTMRNEGLDMYKTGMLQLPENTLLAWDDWPKTGQIRSFPSPNEKNHPGGNGLYYHLTSAQGQWIPYISPETAGNALVQAYHSNMHGYVRFNVGDLREILLTTAAALDAANHTQQWITHTNAAQSFTYTWCARHFVKENAAHAAALYFRLIELENKCRSTSVIEAIAPWITTRELYNLWDPLSVHTLKKKIDSPYALHVYSYLRNLQYLPQRMWPVNAQYLNTLAPQWDELYASATSLYHRLPAAQQTFFFDNVLLHIHTARNIQKWARNIITAFDYAADNSYINSAQSFANAADAMESISRYRARACHGTWTNWYRGESEGLFRKSLWTLKPEWHAGDTRVCAAIADECATTNALVNPIEIIKSSLQSFTISRHSSPLFSPRVTVPNNTHANISRAWVCGIIRDCPAAAQPQLRIGKMTADLPSTQESRRRIFCIETPVSELHDGENKIEFAVNGPVENKKLCYSIHNLILVFSITPDA